MMGEMAEDEINRAMHDHPGYRRYQSQFLRDAQAYQSGVWPVPPVVDAEDSGYGSDLMAALRAITTGSSEPAEPEQALTRAQREQAAHDAVEDATDELARVVRYLRARRAYLAVAVLGATASALVMGMITWWVGVIPLIISVVGTLVMVVQLSDPPKWVDRRATERALRVARRQLRDALTEVET